MGLAFSCPENLAEDLGWAGLQALCDCNFFFTQLPVFPFPSGQPASLQLSSMEI